MTALVLPQPARRVLAMFTMAFAMFAGADLMQSAAAGKIWFEGGVFGSAAVRGYDVVAYFTQCKREFSHKWNNTIWRFAYTQHRDLFIADPAKYAPQYDGWCAWAVSQGATTSIEHTAWRIVDDKLYLNYSKSAQNQ